VPASIEGCIYIVIMPDHKLKADLQKVARQCLARKVRQASRVICSLYDEALRPHGIKTSQFNLLVAIGLLSDITPGELGMRFSLEKSTVSRNVERMRVKGWLESRPKSEARRGVTYRLSRKGRALMERALPDWNAAEVNARSLLGKSGVQALDELASGVIPGL
jgi:DNA-binding MarR family transcriptional regulator